jgi:Holliday junction resolvase
MRRVGQARRRDANEKAIRQALEAVGAHVTPISGKGAPDLLVRYKGRIAAFEVKSAKGDRTVAQDETKWPIVRTVDEALQAIGVQR